MLCVSCVEADAYNSVTLHAGHVCCTARILNTFGLYELQAPGMTRSAFDTELFNEQTGDTYELISLFCLLDFSNNFVNFLFEFNKMFRNLLIIFG